MWITAADVVITNNFHALVLLQSHPDSYDVVQQALFATTYFFTMNVTINAAGIASLCACILTEELHQGPLPSVSVIRKNAITLLKEKCSYCGGPAHWEKDFWHKQHGLSHKEAQAECKGEDKKEKRKDEKEEGQTLVVSAVIVEVPYHPPVVQVMYLPLLEMLW